MNNIKVDLNDKFEMDGIEYYEVIIEVTEPRQDQIQRLFAMNPDIEISDEKEDVEIYRVQFYIKK